MHLSTMNTLDSFTRAYCIAMLWSSTDGEPPEPLDENHSLEDIAPEAMEKIKADCAKFQAENAEHINCDGAPVARDVGDDSAARAGFDFWLTRCGHGVGFWDGDWPEPHGDILTKASKAYGEQWPYVGDDGKIYL